MKTKLTLGWIFVLTGTLFLISGLVVMIFATFNSGINDPTGGVPVEPGFWVSIANALMEFVIDLLEVDWTPIRVGVFLIVVGVLFDGGGAFLITRDGRSKRRR